MRTNTARSADLVDRFIVFETIWKLYRSYQASAEARAVARTVEQSRAVDEENHNARIAVMESTAKSSAELAELNLSVADMKTANVRAIGAHAIEIERKEHYVSKCKLNAVAMRVLPTPKRARFDEILVIIEMSAEYVRAESDPQYLLDCNFIFVRIQKCGLATRLKRIREYGNDTNFGAAVVDQRPTPNARQLYRCLREAVGALTGDEALGMICEYGCETSNIQGVVRLLNNIDHAKYAEATRLLLEEDDDIGSSAVCCVC